MPADNRKPQETHKLQKDAPEGDRATIERELSRQSDKSGNGGGGKSGEQAGPDEGKGFG